MLSKNRIKFLSSLRIKKFRDSSGFFLAEGEKIAGELMVCEDKLLKPVELFATEDFLSTLEGHKINPVIIKTAVDESELKKISSLSAPNKAILLIRKPVYEVDPVAVNGTLTLVLEGIRDPGNLGTIIRTADWFGIRDIFCSMESVDVFNPKAVQGSMGALARVRVHYTEITDFIRSYKENNGLDIIGTLLDGDDMGSVVLPENAMVVFGNESHGISDEVRRLLTHTVKIPSYRSGGEISDSLNVASSVAIMCWEMRRRTESTRSEN